MVLELGESTVAALFDPMLLFPPAVIYHDEGKRPSSSSVLPQVYPTRPIAVRSSTANDNSSVAVKPRDNWLWDTVSAITAHRDSVNWLEEGIEPPSQDALDVAEVLAAGFSRLPINRRPQFSVDGEGRASFSTYENGFYLHLTIAQSGLVSWYSVENDEEIFQDDITVDPLTVHALAEEIMSA